MSQNYINYYPTYSVLDEIVNRKGYKELNLYIDLKNCMQTTYMEHAVLNIVESTIASGRTDTGIFSALLSFLTFHKLYANKRKLKVNTYIYFESGQSFYHLNIDKKYKFNRKIDNLYGLDREKREKFYEVLQKNFQLIESVFNKVPNVKVVRLPYLEADFIPYYLMRNGLVAIGDSIANVIYSNDHDLTQCVTCNDDVHIYQRIGTTKRIVRKNEIVFRELKDERAKSIGDEYLPLIMAINGDTGDGIYGVKGIGPSKICDFFEELNGLIGGSMEELYRRIRSREQIFQGDLSGIRNKYMSKVVDDELLLKTTSNNVRLISFELLSRECDDPSSTEMVERVSHIRKIMESDGVVPSENIYDALTKIGVWLESDQLGYLWT